MPPMGSDERRWLCAELIGPATTADEDWAAECAQALLRAGSLGVEEAPRREGRPVALAWLPAACSRARIEEAIAESGLDASLARASIVEDPGWVEAFNRTLRPIEIGRRLAVVPSDEAAPAGRLAVRIEPGRAFGTGHHESTRLALEWLEESLVPGASVLDVGTGSGILAAAAMVLGGSSAVAIDVDDEALEIARENLVRTLGDGASRVRLVLAASPDPAEAGAGYDVVLANIQADVIHGMLDALVASVAPGGRLVLAGLLAADSEAIDSALARRGFVASWRHDGEWTSACARRE